MKRLLFSILCTLACSVWADGVPLITPGPPLAANDTARQLQATKQPDFVKLHPIKLNKAAFGANILTVVVDGKEHRFVGAMMPPKPPTPKAVTEKQPNTASWYGKEPGGGTLSLTKDVDTGAMLGTMYLLPSRSFHMYTPPGGSTVLVETDANRRPALVYAPDSPAPGAVAAPIPGSR